MRAPSDRASIPADSLLGMDNVFVQVRSRAGTERTSGRLGSLRAFRGCPRSALKVTLVFIFLVAFHGASRTVRDITFGQGFCALRDVEG